VTFYIHSNFPCSIWSALLLPLTHYPNTILTPTSFQQASFLTMPLSLYQATVPPFIRSLKMVSTLLEKGRSQFPDEETRLLEYVMSYAPLLLATVRSITGLSCCSPFEGIPNPLPCSQLRNPGPASSTTWPHSHSKYVRSHCPLTVPKPTSFHPNMTPLFFFR
jgi:hypothetical protein